VREKSFAPLCLLILVGCGVREQLAYRCSVELWPGFIEADRELPCAQVERNAALARRIMAQASPDFGDLLVRSITIREVESWNVEGARAWGTTTFHGRDAEVKLGHSMWSLVHELGHVHLLYTTGDSDHAHLRWESSGQRARDAQYQRAFEPLPTSPRLSPTEPGLLPDQPQDGDVETLGD
jgi:hypothetical protein